MTVSVIIPYIEDRGFLKEAIQSVENQSYKCELILSKSNNSVGYNLNRGIEKCTTDFWAYLSEDDILPTDSIEKRIEAIGDADFIHAKGVIMDDSIYTPHIPAKLYPTLKDMLKKNHILGGTGMYRTEWHEKVQWNEELWTGEELDFHLNLLSKGAKIAYCDEFVYLYRTHKGQKSAIKSQEYLNKRIKSIKEIRQSYE